MAGIIEKIGQYFAHLELEQQRAVALATAQSPAAPPAGAASSREADRALRRTSTIKAANGGNSRLSPSVARRHLSLRSTEPPAPNGTAHEATASHVCAPAQPVVPPMTRPLRPHWGDDSSVSDDNGESLASWRALTSPRASETSGRAVESTTDEDSTVRRRASRGIKSAHAISLKKKIKKRRPPSPATLELQAAARERERSERVAKGFALAQERARRIQEEAQHQARAKRQARQEAVNRIKAQLERIDEVRAQRSASLSSSMASLSPASTPSSGRSFTPRESSSETLSPTSRQEAWAVDASEMSAEDSRDEPHHPCRPTDAAPKRETAFLTELEARTRHQMLLQLEFRKKCLRANKCHERLQQQLARTLERNESKQARISSLEQSKDTTEKQLTSVLDELSALRKQRHELEEAGRNERLRRQREAERALQRRLREEEWAKLMNEEKARTVVAAEARERASERVQKTRWATKQGARSTPHPAIKPDHFIASLGPEIAEFEEEGLCPCSDIDRVDIGSSSNTMAAATNNNQEEEEEPFEWLVPPFALHEAEFDALLRTEMLSDDEDE